MRLTLPAAVMKPSIPRIGAGSSRSLKLASRRQANELTNLQILICEIAVDVDEQRRVG
jgi:hypothetical protein